MEILERAKFSRHIYAIGKKLPSSAWMRYTLFISISSPAIPSPPKARATGHRPTTFFTIVFAILSRVSRGRVETM